jgi:hypothetical protein
MNWFNCKISYLKQAENGSIIKKTSEYLINALTFTEAESRLHKSLEGYIDEFNLLACKKTKICDVVFDETQDSFFNVKVNYISFDEDFGKEKKIIEQFLVQADDLTEANKKMATRLQGSIIEWKMPSIVQTKIEEVFNYVEK